MTGEATYVQCQYASTWGEHAHPGVQGQVLGSDKNRMEYQYMPNL